MIKFYRGSRENYNVNEHSEGIYFANDTAEILTGQENSYGKNADASRTTADIVVAGGPLANNVADSADVWPWALKDGNKVIPAGTSIQDILQGLFLKTVNGTVKWGNITWNPSLNQPTVTLSSDGPVEVGANVTCTVSTTSTVSSNQRKATCTASQGHFNSVSGSYVSGNKTVTKDGTTGGSLSVEYTWNGSNVASFESASTALKVKEGDNEFKVSQSGITASVEALPETTVYASTNTKTVLADVSATLTDSTPASKNLSSNKSDTLVGSYYYFIGQASGTGLELTSELIRGLNAKKGFVSQLDDNDVLASVTVSAGGHTYIIAVPEGYTIKQILALNSDAKAAWSVEGAPKATVAVKLPDNSEKMYNVFYCENAGGADSAFTNLKLGAE